ncbi:MAG: hypothetical protein IPK12_01185 [Gemmatimonadetes bacterium]|nr:hypothetical protein [Gemmatimonadota bacterium]
MMLGLLRWPTLQWALATAYTTTPDPTAHATLAALFDGFNLYLGNYLGEFVGELVLNLFFLLTALATRGDARFPRAGRRQVRRRGAARPHRLLAQRDARRGDGRGGGELGPAGVDDCDRGAADAGGGAGGSGGNALSCSPWCRIAAPATRSRSRVAEPRSGPTRTSRSAQAPEGRASLDLPYPLQRDPAELGLQPVAVWRQLTVMATLSPFPRPSA